MGTISRRTALRLAGGAVGSVAAGTGFLGTAHPASARAGGWKHHTDIKRVLAAGTPIIGMSSPAEVWRARVRAVGPGLTARRIFADLARGPHNLIGLVEKSHRDGMLPVISYKVGRDVAGAIAGEFDDRANRAAEKLASFDKPTAVTFWHEPLGDMSPDEYVAASLRILPHFRRGKLRVGPILNGWLLDRKVSTFETFCPDELFEIWDWFGINAYESGSIQSPGAFRAADRIRALSTYLATRGYADMPIGIGEYNGFTADSVTEAGEALFTTPHVWFGCVWNTTGGRGHRLAGARLRAFRATLADPRSLDPVPA